MCNRGTLGMYVLQTPPPRRRPCLFPCILLTEVAIIMPQRDVIITGHKNKQQTLLCQQPLRKKAHTSKGRSVYGSLVKSIQLYTKSWLEVRNCTTTGLHLFITFELFFEHIFISIHFFLQCEYAKNSSK